MEIDTEFKKHRELEKSKCKNNTHTNSKIQIIDEEPNPLRISHQLISFVPYLCIIRITTSPLTDQDKTASWSLLLFEEKDSGH